jgi:hypothetical protein
MLKFDRAIIFGVFLFTSHRYLVGHHPQSQEAMQEPNTNPNDESEKWGAPPPLPHWRSLFDVVVVSARKPDFFTSKMPVLEGDYCSTRLRYAFNRVNFYVLDSLAVGALELSLVFFSRKCAIGLRGRERMASGPPSG